MKIEKFELKLGEASKGAVTVWDEIEKKINEIIDVINSTVSIQSTPEIIDIFRELIKEKEPEIKNCPFCGHKPKISRFIFDMGKSDREIKCVNLECKTHPSTEYCFSEEEAIEAWNSRKG